MFGSYPGKGREMSIFKKAKKDSVFVRFHCVNGKPYDLCFSNEEWQRLLKRTKNGFRAQTFIYSDNKAISLEHVVYFELIE